MRVALLIGDIQGDRWGAASRHSRGAARGLALCLGIFVMLTGHDGRLAR